MSIYKKNTYKNPTHQKPTNENSSHKNSPFTLKQLLDHNEQMQVQPTGTTQPAMPEQAVLPMPNEPQGPQPFLGQTGGLAPQQDDLEKLFADPVGFVQAIATATVDSSAEKYLADLKEEAELKAAIHGFQKQYPEFERFRPFILQEVAHIIEYDADGHIDPWETLLEKAGKRFQAKLKQELSQSKPSGSAMQTGLMAQATPPPQIESAGAKQPQKAAPAFSRKAIANMSLAEFLANEADIDAALQGKRIY
ncbi:MAG: hypothetical protein AAGI66_10120 [Cyanobacteria bacterium P01_H01_bin.74]